MDAPVTMPDTADELAVLQRRAYGPDADIHDDADALARLRELEGSARVPIAPSRPTPGDAVVSEQAAAPTILPEAAVARSAEVDEALPAEVAAKGLRARAAHLWHRTPRWAPIVMVLAVGIAVGTTLPSALAPRPDATLAVIGQIEDTVINPGDALSWFQLDRATLREHEQFGGFRIFSGVNAISQHCMLMTIDADLMTGTCAPAVMPVVLDLTLDAGWAARSGLAGLDVPVGSFLRLSLRDDVVEVWIAPPAPDDAIAPSTLQFFSSASTSASDPRRA